MVTRNIKIESASLAAVAVPTVAADGSAAVGYVLGFTNINPVTGEAAGAGFTGTAAFTPGTGAHAANDVIGGAQPIVGIGPVAGGEIIITGSLFWVEAGALLPGEGAYDLHLYSVTPPSALADDAGWDLPSGDRASYRGKISLGTPVDLGSTCYVEQTGLTKQVAVPAGGALYGYLVTAGGFTPAAVARQLVLKAIPV